MEKKFSGSPRVSLLLGLRMESLGDIDGARKVYEGLLAKDETNVVSRCSHSTHSTHVLPIVRCMEPNS